MDKDLEESENRERWREGSEWAVETKGEKTIIFYNLISKQH